MEILAPCVGLDDPLEELPTLAFFDSVNYHKMHKREWSQAKLKEVSLLSSIGFFKVVYFFFPEWCLKT